MRHPSLLPQHLGGLSAGVRDGRRRAGRSRTALRILRPRPTSITVNVQATLSNLADLSTSLMVKARGGFRFGSDPLDNWCCDAVIVNPASIDGAGWPSGSLTPTLLTLSKAYSGSEDETATGPNFPRRYTVTAGIAASQSVTGLTIDDTLPDNLQFSSVVSTSPAAACTPPPAGHPRRDVVVHLRWCRQRQRQRRLRVLRAAVRRPRRCRLAAGQRRRSHLGGQRQRGSLLGSRR